MLDRDNQFPDRQTVIRGKRLDGGVTKQPQESRSRSGKKPSTQSPQKPPSPSVGKRIPAAFLLLGFVFALITLSGSYLDEAAQLLDRLWSDQQPGRKPVQQPAPSASRTHAQVADSNRQSEETTRKQVAEPIAEGDLTLSIGKVFRPVGFVVAARYKDIPLFDQPDRLFKRLPELSGAGEKYGVIELQGGQQYRFVLDMAPKGYRLYLDRNRNGNLRDDGPAVVNAGKGLFANKLVFSLAKVTGIPKLQGDYTLWLFANNQSWQNSSLRAYSRTQLSGQLRLNGKVYRAYLTDSPSMDANYGNDGLGIDLNENGKIETVEYLPPGGQIKVAGVTYRVKFTR
ncbi:MAG: hypothetical protein MI754_19100 [Chromatiales bacterium]|nr:hypothetical protein [Chromatiales bacterium]